MSATLYRVKPYLRAFAVFGADNVRNSEELSLADAMALKVELETPKRERLAEDPEVLKRRAKKALDRNPVYKAFKNLRDGRWKRATQDSWESLKKPMREVDQLHIPMTEGGEMAGPPLMRKVRIGTHMTIASSDPDAHAELNKTAGQHRVSPAAGARRLQGDPARAEVRSRWEALALEGVLEHKRAPRIEKDTGIKNVSRIVAKLGLKTKKKRP